MENPEKPREMNRLEELQEAIKSAPQKVQAEFEKNLNPWLSCLVSSVEVVDIYLNSSKLKSLLPEEKIKSADEKLNGLKQKISSLKEQYPDRETTPPEDLQNELLRKLDVLQDEEPEK
jgi:hypothetical protein